MKVSWDDDYSQYMGTLKMFQTTNQTKKLSWHFMVLKVKGHIFVWLNHAKT